MKIVFDDLMNEGLVRQKKYDNGLKISKYTKKVFFDNLWYKDHRLLDARGIVTDNHDNVVVWPFTKVFNYGENATTVDRDKTIVWAEKVNGFLGCVTNTEEYGVIYSTTGTLDSEYAELIKKHVPEEYALTFGKGRTYMFEIVDESDPHIINHKPGAYLIGCRQLVTGQMLDEWHLDAIAAVYSFYRPRWGVDRFSDLVKKSKEVEHEGFVVRDTNHYGDLLLKIKSPYYLSKKFLMRMGDGKVKAMWEDADKYKQNIDEEFYSIVDFLVATYDVDIWMGMTDTERKAVIEERFNAK